jgi:hypothetical protein
MGMKPAQEIWSGTCDDEAYGCVRIRCSGPDWGRDNGAYADIFCLSTVLFSIEALFLDVPRLFSRPIVLSCVVFAGMLEPPFND